MTDFLYLKIETEDVTDVTPVLPAKKRLKVGTFKILPRHTRRGERFMKKIMDRAMAEDVDEVYVYASAPVSKVIGEFEPVDVVTDEPAVVWKMTRQFSGITKKFFDEYFAGRAVAHAIVIQNLKRYKRAIALPKGVHAPQSYCYVESLKVQG